MQFPLNIHFWNITINLHLIFEVLAYTAGFQYYLYLRKHTQDKISFEDRIWIIIAAAAGALVGSRIIGYFSFPLSGKESIIQMWIFWVSNKSILGGLIGGIFGVEIAKKLMGIKMHTGDLFVYPIILGIMIGRIGCFSQGVYDGTHGLPSNLLWAIDMGDGIPRHPTQLYEIIFLGIIWFIIKRNEYHLAEGARFKVFVGAYLLYRFLIEWIRPVYFYNFGFSTVQIACIVGFIYYIPVLINPRSLFKE